MGVSGNSVAGKSFQMFTVSEELLQKVTEAVQAGEKKAKSSGEIQSLEVFCHGFRQNISLGRVMVVPPSVCSDRKNFPTALLHGALVRVFGTGGEEISDLIEKKIGESEFDEYSQADFDTLKESLFVDPRTEKEACLIVFAPNWMNSREYISFHFTKDSDELKNNLRHQVFSAYFDPRVSSAFNAMMTNVNTTKVDVTDVTPKMNFPFLAENILKEYPRLDKQAGKQKPTILLNHKTADDVTKQTLEPQELDVFDSLNTALENSLGVDSGDGAQGEGGFTAPEATHGVPRAAAANETGPICTCGHMYDEHKDGKCKKCDHCKGYKKNAANKKADVNPLASHEAPFVNVGPGRDASEEQQDMAPAVKESSDDAVKQNKDKATKPIGIEIDAQGRPVHKGDDVKKHRATKKTAMNTFKVTFEDGNSLTTGFNGTLQDAEAYYLNNDFQFGDTDEHPGDKLVRGVKVEEVGGLPSTGLPATGLRYGDPEDMWETRQGSKTASEATNPSSRKHDKVHPETQRVDPTRLSSAYSAAYNGGFVDKHAMPPQKVRSYMEKHMGNDSDYAPHAVADHAKQIEAGLFGEDGLNRRSNEKWGTANIPVKFKQSTAAEFVADHIAKELGEESESMSDKAKQARAKKENLLDKFRPAKYAEEEINIDTIWDEITTDIGPAPLVDVESDPSNPAPSNTEAESQSRPAESDEPESPQSAGRLNKRDVQDMPEAMRSPEPEDTKSLSDSEADAQEDSMPHADSDTEESTHQSSWRVDNKLADFVEEVYGDVNNDHPSQEAMEQAQRAIDNEDQIIFDVAANLGQHVDNVKHMDWFVESVAHEIDEQGANNAEWSEDSTEVEACGEGTYVGDNNPAMMASAKTADVADNEYDIDAAGKPETAEDGVSKTVDQHRKYDEHGQVYASKKKADTADNPALERGGEGAIEVKTDKVITNTHGTTPQYDVTGSAKKADTADNPYNMTNDGEGAPENKKVVRVKDTTGPTPDNTKQAQNQNKGVKQEIGEKHDHGIEGDIAQAKSECDSPDTVDKDIKI